MQNGGSIGTHFQSSHGIPRCLWLRPWGIEAVGFYKERIEKCRVSGRQCIPKALHISLPDKQQRSSTTILDTLDIEKINELAPIVDAMSDNITSPMGVCEAIKLSWQKKKETSPEIITPELQSIEDMLWRTDAKALKLLGAGGGGYFLAIYNRPFIGNNWRPISLDYKGVTSTNV